MVMGDSGIGKILRCRMKACRWDGDRVLALS